MSDEESELEQLRAEVEGLKATVQSQARIIGQLRGSVTNDSVRIKELQDAKNRALRWERIAMKRFSTLQCVLGWITNSKGQLDSLAKDIHGGLTDTV